MGKGTLTGFVQHDNLYVFTGVKTIRAVGRGGNNLDGE
jgi:hypothetical protein